MKFPLNIFDILKYIKMVFIERVGSIQTTHKGILQLTDCFILISHDKLIFSCLRDI